MTSIDPELLPLLACPESRQPLRMADEGMLESINRAIAAGTMKNVGGQAVTDEVTEGLVREDSKVVYAIRGGIPVLLVDEGLPVPGA